MQLNQGMLLVLALGFCKRQIADRHVRCFIGPRARIVKE
jgi:hypothetical protein